MMETMGGIDSAENSDEFASLVGMVELKSRKNARTRKVFLSVFATVSYSVFFTLGVCWKCFVHGPRS